MKTRFKNIISKSHQLCAHLLILLMLSIPFVQLVHHHEGPVIAYADQDGKASFDKSVEQCKLCDYLAHNYGKEYLLSSAHSLNLPLPKPIKVCAHVIAGNYTFTLQGFTNKGPPAQSFIIA